MEPVAYISLRPPLPDPELIEPGIRDVCNLINFSGVGLTEFSCQGHTYAERGQYGNGEPYVCFRVLDTPKCLALIPALMSIGDDDFTCDAAFGNVMGYPRMTIRLWLSEGKYGYLKKSPTVQRRRQKALERARKTLLDTLHQNLSAPSEERKG